MTVKFTPLPDLTASQLDKLLSNFQLKCKSNSVKNKISVLKCVESFDMKFSTLKDEDILVGFNKSDNLHEVKSRDDTIKLIKDASPCNTCGRPVDDKDIGLRCCGCSQFFHNRCTSQPVSKEVYKHIINTPNWVKVMCPKCIIPINKRETSLKTIEKQVSEVHSQMKDKAGTFSSAAKKNIQNTNSIDNQTAQKLANNLRTTNKIMEKICTQNNGTDKKELDKKTLLIRKYMDKNIRNSMQIKKCINENYPGTIIPEARTTAGGSIFIIFDTEEMAKMVKQEWNKDLFGGNEGAFLASERPSIGIVKYVYQEKTTEELTEDINEIYPDAKCEFFTKNNKFTGTIKVAFKDEEELNEAIENRITIGRQRYLVEKFIGKPRVIRCMRCQQFGHVQRVCHAESPRCGKCSNNDHETKDCPEEEANYKCFHCSENHPTGSKNCRAMKEKLELLLSRNHGYFS